MSVKRLNRELNNLRNPESEKCLPPNCTAETINDDLFNWSVSIAGPEGSPYEGSKYGVEISYASQYPFKPPSVRFTTKVYHCNVNPDNGQMCLSILGENGWVPSLTSFDIIVAVQSLLASPDPSNPINQECCSLLASNESQYKNKIQEWKNQYATPL